MQRFRKTTLIGAVLLSCAAHSLLASADELRCSPPRADPLLKLLSPPPCDSCAQTKIELDELQTLERNRSDAQAKHALADYEISVARFLAGADIKFDAEGLAKCKPFFDRFGEKTKEAAEHAKSAFCRTRPYDLPNSELKPLQTGKYSPSYPSGHTTFGAALGAVLAQMVPEKREELYARSADYGRSRMIAGVHFRSDIEAGKLLGMEVAAEEFASDAEFKASFPNATTCVREALGLASKPTPTTAEAPAAKP